MHLIAVGNKLDLSFQDSEVKNKNNLDFKLPDESKELIDWYVKTYRQAAPENRALFPGRAGGAKKLNTLRDQITKTIRKFLGVEVNPHLFRHIVAMCYLEQNPGAYEVIRQVLGHKQMDTTTKYYAGQETRAANRHFAETIMKLRASRPEDQDL